MKSILLASASIVAFAGAAAAEVTFGGEAKLGYNDTAIENDGFYWSADLNTKLSQALNNGLTASATLDFDLSTDNDGDALVGKNFLLELASENSSLQFGDVEFAAISVWSTAGAVLENDGFSEQDGETVLRGNVNYSGVDARISYIVDAESEDGIDVATSDVDQLSLGAKAAFGNFNVALAYQEESEEILAANRAGEDLRDLKGSEIFGLTAGTTFGGANVVLSYANNLTVEENSIGVSVAYPVGPVSLRGWVATDSQYDDLSYGLRAIYAADAYSVTANYEQRANRTGTDMGRWNLEGSYKVGNGLTAYAGILGRDVWEGEAYYVAGEMDLGNGAALLVSYADADKTNAGYLADDEVGAREYQNGLTAEVSFTF